MNIDYPHPEQLPDLRRLWQLAFGDSEAFLHSFFSTAFSPDRCRCISEAGQVLAALYWFDCVCDGETLAYVYAVATHPDHRGRGLCRALMTDTHAHLTAHGYAGSLLVPQEEGLRILYRGLGYDDCTAISQFDCTAGNTPLSLRAVTPEEYAARRREFLPPRAVIQEGENLDFLKTQVQFYAGPGILLAVAKEEDSLFCPELLGDPSAAPRILHTLGALHGTFRTPGSTVPFTMYRPLTATAPVPSHFAFAFD